MTAFNDGEQTTNIQAINSTKDKLLFAAILLGILLLSAFFISKSLSVNFPRYQQYRDNTLELQKVDSTFNQEILKSRYELFASYDTLVRSLAKQKNIQKQLENIPNFVPNKEKQEIESILKEIKTVVNKRENLSERFKSRNALLKNSLRYLPLLTSQLEEKLEAQKQGKILAAERISSLRRTLNSLIRNLLLYNVAVDEKLRVNIEASTEKLSQLDIQYELTEEQFPTELVKSHANIILTTKPTVEQLTNQLLQPLQQYTKSLEETLDNSYKQAGRRVNLYRLLTFVWFGLLLILVDYFLLKRWRQFNPGLSRYKKQVGKLTAVLADISPTKNGSYDTGISALVHSSSNNLPVKIFSSSNSESELVDLSDRTDELGQLARSVQEMVVERVAREQTAANEESFASLTARLILVTKNRRKMISPTTIDDLKTIFGNALDEWRCKPIDFQGSLEQVEIVFSYPPQIELLQLVAYLKAVSSSYFERNLGDVLGSIDDEGEIWSSSYSITSCKGNDER